MTVSWVDLPIIDLTKAINISALITFHHFDLPGSYNSPNEQYDFWELFYIDQGKMVSESLIGKQYLQQGDVILFAPGVSHTMSAVDNCRLKLLIVSFLMDEAYASYFSEKVFHCNDQEKELLARVLEEGVVAFGIELNSLRDTNPTLQDHAPFGSCQLLRNYIEILMIQFMRHIPKSGKTREDKLHCPLIIDNAEYPQYIYAVIDYLNQCINSRLSIKQLCSIFHVSRSKLLQEFKQNTGYGLILFLNMLKINKSKIMIKEENRSLTEIAYELGYKDLGTFSRQFKRMVGISPSEYAKLLINR